MSANLISNNNLQVVVSPQNEAAESPFVNFPDELCLLIFTKCGAAKDVATFSLLCRKFNQLCSDRFLWKFLFQAHFPYSSALVPPQPLDGPTDKYLALYKDRYVFKDNLMRGRAVTSTSLVSQPYKPDFRTTTRPYGILRYGHSIPEYGDTTITFWDMKTQKCILTFENIEAHVCIPFKDCLYVVLREAGSKSRVQILDMLTGEPLNAFELEGLGRFEEEGIEVEEFDEEGKEVFKTCLFASSSAEETSTIKIWDLTTGELLKTFDVARDWDSLSVKGKFICSTFRTHDDLEGDDTAATLNLSTGGVRRIINNATINFYEIIGNHLITFDQLKMKIWDLNSGECVQSLTSPESIMNTGKVGNYLYTSSSQGAVEIWDITHLPNMQRLELFDVYKDKIIRSTVSVNCLFSLLSDNTIRILDLTTNEHQTLDLNKEGIESIQYYRVFQNRLATFSADSKISIWCLKTGSCLHVFKASGGPFVGERGTDPNAILRQALFLVENLLFLQSDMTKDSKFEVFDVTGGGRIASFTAPHLERTKNCHLIGDRLILENLSGNVGIYDFGRDLEMNVAILGQLGQMSSFAKSNPTVGLSAEAKKADDKKFLAKQKQLYPPILRRLYNALHHYDLSVPPAILHVQTEIRAEVLLRAIEDENGWKVREMLGELKATIPETVNTLYHSLWEECGKPFVLKKDELAPLTRKEISEAVDEVLTLKKSDEMQTDPEDQDVDASVDRLEAIPVSGSEWGEKAFFGEMGYHASTESKIAAVKKLLATLTLPTIPRGAK